MFGVSERQLRADLEVLWFCGLPGLMPGDLIEVDMEAVDGEGVIRVGNAEYLSRPLRLGVEEAVALLIALRALAESVDGDERATVTRLIARLEEAAGQAGGVAGNVALQLPERHLDPAISSAVRTALAAGRRLHLTYWVPSRDETTERDVDPLQWVEADSVSYLEAWCRSAEDVRLFRLDRIAAATVLDVASSPPADVVTREGAGDILRPNPTDLVVRLVLEAHAAWVAEYYPMESVTALGGGRVEVSIRVKERRWVERLLIRLGGAATVLEPADLIDDVRRTARDALANYS
jgi:proteasome accessory factor C